MPAPKRWAGPAGPATAIAAALLALFAHGPAAEAAGTLEFLGLFGRGCNDLDRACTGCVSSFLALLVVFVVVFIVRRRLRRLDEAAERAREADGASDVHYYVELLKTGERNVHEVPRALGFDLHHNASELVVAYGYFDTYARAASGALIPLSHDPA